MNGNLYELIAIGARYLFAVIMIVIVIRAWKITIVDSRRAASLRRLSPETGVCGEFLILTGSGKVREGMRYPVIREGLIGSSRKADIRLRARDVRRSHAFFELTKKGLRLRAQRRSKIYNSRGEAGREFMLGDGAKITVGDIEMMLILTDGTAAHEESAPESDIFDIPDDSEIFIRRPHTESAVNNIADTNTRAPSDLFAQPVNRGSISPEAEDTLCSEIYTAYQPQNSDKDHILNTRTPEYHHTETGIPDDIFMESTPSILKPENDIWGDNEPETPVKIWDDWDERPAKTQVKRQKYDDPFDI